MIAVMGLIFVGIAFLVGLFALAPAQSAFFSDAKVIREAAGAGSLFMDANVTSQVIEAWVPQFKFLGLGLGLMAITMALGIIAKKLRHMGMTITGHMSSSFRPSMPPIPGRVRWFQLSTLMGVMILLGALIVGIVLVTGVVPAYCNISIADVLNQAQPGSALLAQLGVVKSFHFWLDPVRIVDMSFLFTAITLALTVIIGTLRQQAKLLVGFFYQASS